MYPSAGRTRKRIVKHSKSISDSLHSGISFGSRSLISGGKTVKKHVQRGISQVQQIPDKDYTWRDLNKIEKRRREILGRRGRSFLGILLFWDGTVLSALSTDPFFYILLALYLSIRVFARFQIPEFVASVAAANTGIIGGFLSFFLALYVNSANERFGIMYQNSRACQGGIFDAAALARTTLPRERALRLIRYLNAAVSGCTYEWMPLE